MWADQRPNDHDRPGIPRDMPCPMCGHPAHYFTRCGSVLDAAFLDVLCPCHHVPAPGIYA